MSAGDYPPASDTRSKGLTVLTPLQGGGGGVRFGSVKFGFLY
jgi:hypothetical protein